MTESFKLSVILEFLKLVENIYLAKEGHLADCIFLIFDLIILSQSIALLLCYNKNSRQIYYLWHWIPSYIWMRRESTGVKQRNTFHNRIAACRIECIRAIWYTCHNQDTIHNKTPHMPENVEWLAYIDRIMIELQNVSFELQGMFPHPKSQEEVRAKLRKLRSWYLPWHSDLEIVCVFLICNGVVSFNVSVICEFV